jgi:hypothetical protein
VTTPYDDEDLNYTGSATTFLEDEDQETAPEYADVPDFAATCPTDGWTYEGTLNGGEQFTWSGYAAWPGYDAAWTTAKLHVHPDWNAMTWDWGGLWIEDWAGSGISINGDAPGARNHLQQIVQDWLDTNGL